MTEGFVESIDMGGLLANTIGVSDFSFVVKGEGLQLNQLDTELSGIFPPFISRHQLDTIAVNLMQKMDKFWLC